jgi:hypothetical protein
MIHTCLLSLTTRLVRGFAQLPKSLQSMSGIAGIINFNGKPVPHEEMIMMTSAMH